MVVGEYQLSESSGSLLNPHGDGRRQLVAGEVLQHGNSILRGKAGAGGVPQGERSEAVGVQVLRGALQLGKGDEGRLALLGTGSVDIQQDGSVALDNQGIVELHNRIFYQKKRGGRNCEARVESRLM